MQDREKAPHNINIRKSYTNSSRKSWNNFWHRSASSSFTFGIPTAASATSISFYKNLSFVEFLVDLSSFWSGRVVSSVCFHSRFPQDYGAKLSGFDPCLKVHWLFSFDHVTVSFSHASLPPPPQIARLFYNTHTHTHKQTNTQIPSNWKLLGKRRVPISFEKRAKLAPCT